MGRTLSIYGHLGASRVRAAAQYRTSFAFQIVGAFLLSFIDFVMILVLFHHLTRLAGWTLPEIAFLYGTSYVAFRTADIAMTNLDRLPTLIRLGTFDQILTRPLGSLGQVLTGDLDVRHVGGIMQGALVLVYALGRVGIEWTPGRAVVFASMLVCAVAIFCSIWVATNAIAFWTTDAREVANTFTYGGNYFTQYPLHIFGRWLRRLFVFVVPLGFVNYYPGLYLLGKPDPTHAPSWFRFASPAAAVFAISVAALVWRTAVRRYRSTGS